MKQDNKEENTYQIIRQLANIAYYGGSSTTYSYIVHTWKAKSDRRSFFSVPESS